jgi:hypothetical protein
MNQILVSEYQGLTKAQIGILAEETVNNALETGNQFKIAEGLAVMEKFIKSVREDARFVEYVRLELSRYPNGKLTTPSGALIEVCETAVSYDYSQNPEWVRLDEEIKQLTAIKKKLEESIRRVQPGKILVDQETGETLVGASKSSKSSFKITLSK